MRSSKDPVTRRREGEPGGGLEWLRLGEGAGRVERRGHRIQEPGVRRGSSALFTDEAPGQRSDAKLSSSRRQGWSGARCPSRR